MDVLRVLFGFHVRDVVYSFPVYFFKCGKSLNRNRDGGECSPVEVRWKIAMVKKNTRIISDRNLFCRAAEFLMRSAMYKHIDFRAFTSGMEKPGFTVS